MVRGALPTVSYAASPLVQPAKLKAPLTRTHPDKVQSALQNERSRNKELENKISSLQEQVESLKIDLEKNSLPVSPELHLDMKHILENSKIATCDFMRLFCEEQMKYLGKSSKGVRYHPQIIRSA